MNMLLSMGMEDEQSLSFTIRTIITSMDLKLQEEYGGDLPVFDITIRQYQTV